MKENRRKILILIIPMFFGMIIAWGGLEYGYSQKNTKFEEMALGKGTSSLFAQYKGYPIHCYGIEDSEGCLEGWHVTGEKPVVLWLGNSQVHAVNQLRSGDENAPPILFRDLYSQGLYLLTFSQPNASLQEHYVLFEYLKLRLPVRTLILPLVFDDLRETGIRPDISLSLKDDRVVNALETTEIGAQILEQSFENQQVSSVDLGSDDFTGVRNTLQEHSELAIDNWLSTHSKLWRTRAQARGSLFTNLYLLRNSFFGITAQSKRKMIKPCYYANIKALAAIIDSAQESGITVLIYIVPIRNDIDMPYVNNEYEAFKKEVCALTKGKNVECYDLDCLVPNGFWGKKGSTNLEQKGLETDFMHFQAPGHQLLAQKLNEILKKDFRRKKLDI